MNFKGFIKKTIYGSLSFFSGSFPYFGTKVFFPKNSLVFNLACEHGIYEAVNSLLIRSLVCNKPESVYFDIGANIGLLAIPALQECNSCKVVSYEPSPETLKFLKQTARESKFTERWQIVDKALGSKDGKLEFFTASVENSALDGFRNTGRAGNMKSILVEVTTLDKEWESLGKPEVSVIKIDVEGAEMDVLNGSLNCLKTKKPYVLIEWNKENLKPYNCSPNILLDFSTHIQYRLYSLPNLILITDYQMLNLHMCRTESFLLEPLLLS